MRRSALLLRLLVFFLLFLPFYQIQEAAQVQERSEVFFSPAGGAQEAILDKLETAKTEIDVAMYILSNQELADALIAAQRRGSLVRVLLDGSEDEHLFSRGKYLYNSGVHVRIDRSHMLSPDETQGIMHNKFAIIDDTTIITGSYNWTNAAEIHNDENVLILNNAKDIAHRYKAQFERLWDRGVSYDVKQLPAPLVIAATDLKTLREQANKKAYVQGVVHDVYFSERSGTYFLHFGPERSSFTGVIFKSSAEKFAERGNNPKEYEGKPVELYGKIIDHPKYGLEIIIDDPIQIRYLSKNN